MFNRIIFFTFCGVIFQLQSQSVIEKTFFSEKLNDTFKNVSLLVARHFEEIEITPLKKGNYQIETVLRIQYYIKDMAALDNFKTLDKYANAKNFQVKQIKPDGTTQTIYEFENKNYDPESIFNDDEDSPKENQQMPLENIEIGDIVDYRYLFIKKTSVAEYKALLINNGRYINQYLTHPNNNHFRSLINRDKLLNPKNPILNYCLAVIIPKDLKFNSKSLNLKEKFELKKIEGISYYEFKKYSIKSNESEDFSYSYLTIPSIKFSIVQTNPELLDKYPYQFLNPEVTLEDVANLGFSFYNNKNFKSTYLYYQNTSYHSDPYIEVSLSKFFKRFNSTFTKNISDKTEMLNLLHEYLTNEDELNEEQYADMDNMVILARYCDYIKLPYNILACMPRYNGSWQDVLTPYDVSWGLYIPNNGQPLYITDYSKTGNIYQKFGYLSNTDIIIINKVTKNFEIKKYPEVSFKENTTINLVEVKLKNDSSYQAMISYKTMHKGYNKFSIDDYISPYFNCEGLYVNTPFYGLVNYNRIYSFDDYRDTGVFFSEYRRLNQSFSDLKSKYKNKNFERFIEKEFEFYDFKLDSFNLHNDGFYLDNENDSLGLSYHINTQSLIKETNISEQKILALGKLITFQYQISPFKVEERLTDINISHQRKLQWRIKVELPKGYQCLNLQTFNQKVENEAGIFESTLKEKDGFLYLNVDKIYKTHALPKEKWLQMVEFLQKASFLYDQELIIEKIAQ